MGAVESAIADLIREIIEEVVDITSEEEIEKIAESAVADHLDRHLCEQVSEALQRDNSVREALAGLLREFMEVERVAREQDLDRLRVDFQREIEVRSLKYKVRATGQRICAWFNWTLTGRPTNARKVCLWTLLI